MDILSQILDQMNVQSVIISNWQLTEPWGIDIRDFNAGSILTVVSGHCYVTAPGMNAVKLGVGDSLLSPCGHPCELSCELGAATAPLSAIWQQRTFRGFDYYSATAPVTINWGGNGQETQLLGLAFEFQPGIHEKFLASLPHFIFPKRNNSALSSITRAAIDMLSNREMEIGPGYLSIANHLAELVFVSELRTYFISAQSQTNGLIRGLADKQLAKALTAIHSRPNYSWSVALLAKQAQMSRSSFADRFGRLLGSPPITYLNDWRIQLASDQLLKSQHTITHIAEHVGFNSDRAFRKTFKQHVGISPQQYRREKRSKTYRST